MNLIGKLIRKVEGLSASFSLVGNTSFFDSVQFSWVKSLESNWMTIRQELERILKYEDALPNFQDISLQQYAITQGNRWKTYFLHGYGIKAEINCERCPETTHYLTHRLVAFGARCTSESEELG